VDLRSAVSGEAGTGPDFQLFKIMTFLIRIIKLFMENIEVFQIYSQFRTNNPELPR
jgi:hypothetical protein